MNIKQHQAALMALIELDYTTTELKQAYRNDTIISELERLADQLPLEVTKADMLNLFGMVMTIETVKQTLIDVIVDTYRYSSPEVQYVNDQAPELSLAAINQTIEGGE